MALRMPYKRAIQANYLAIIEHTAHMAYMIYKACVKQRSLVVTLLDFKNSFGEVHHRLFKEFWIITTSQMKFSN